LTENKKITYILLNNKEMKTLNLHTISYQPMPTLAWGGTNVCDFNSKRIEMQLGADIILG
jgi:hypothetical protein